MKKNSRRNNGLQKEKIFMIGASVFVLTALTLTGVYVSDKGSAGENRNIIDFSELEEQGKNLQGSNEQAKTQNIESEEQAKKEKAGAEELISEANSMKVENQKRKADQNAEVTKTADQDKYGNTVTENQKKKYGEAALIENTKSQDAVTTEEGGEAVVANAAGTTTLHFTEAEGLEWPIAGKVLLNYSMDKAIFYPTMQQYRYNPSIVIGATEGEPITAAADGIVESVFQDAELGQGIVCSLGDEYELTYGQLKDLTVSEGSLVKKGELIGYVAKPTIYYSQEGSNVYFKLTHAGTPVDPMTELGD